MNRKEYNLLIENWRNFLKENVEVEDDWNWDEEDDSLSNNDIIKQMKENPEFAMNWGSDPGYLQYGKIGVWKVLENNPRGYPEVSMKKGTILNKNNNPVYDMVEKLFGEKLLEFSVGGGMSPLGLLNRFASEGLSDFPQVYAAVFVKDVQDRRDQVRCIFNCLKEMFPDLRDEGMNLSDIAGVKDLEDSYKKYLRVWRGIENNKKSSIIWEIIDKMKEKKLLPEDMR